MTVYFFRHVSAGQHTVLPKEDEKRPIDKIGEQQCRDVGRALLAMGVEVDVVISSPLTRAIQTAKLTVEELGYKDRIVISDAMRPEGSYDQFLDLLEHYSNTEAIMVVGHNPSITEFLLRLVTGSDHAERIDFKKGAIAKVEVTDGEGVLQWLFTPKMVSKIQAFSDNRSRPKTSRK